MEKKILISCLLVFLLCLVSVGTATPDGMESVEKSTDMVAEIEWEYTFGGIADDEALAILQTADDGFVLLGVTSSYGAGESDMWLVKTNATGHHEWNHTFGGMGSEGASLYDTIVQTSDEGFAFAGLTNSYGAGESDMWLVKTNATGHHEWNHTFGGTSWDHANTLVQTVDGGFALAGRSDSYSFSGEWMQAWLVKTNATGHHEWNHTYGGTSVECVNSMIQTADEGFIFTSYKYSSGTSDIYSDMWLVKTNATGHHEWNRTMGGIDEDVAYSLIQTVDGGFVLAGGTNSYGAGVSDMWLIKTNTSGHHEWNRTFGGTSFDTASTVIQTVDGGFLLVGKTNSYGAGGSGIWLVKTDSMGQYEWDDTFGGWADEGGGSVVQTADKEFVFVGFTETFGAGGADMWLVKIQVSEALTTTTTTTTTTDGTFGFELGGVVLVFCLSAFYSRKRRR
jgi:hypothetical protein